MIRSVFSIRFCPNSIQHKATCMSQSEDTQAEFQGLLQRVRAGDQSAQNDLFQKYRPYLRMLAQSNVDTWMQAKTDASDIVQESMIDACRGIKDFAGTTEAEWLAWLKKIVNNNLHDMVRHYKGAAKRDVTKERSWEVSSTGQSGRFERAPAGEEPRPSQIMMQSEREQYLAYAIGKLDDDYREVIRLRNLQRLPFEEVAEQMDRSRSAVQMLWTRAMVKLSEEMKRKTV